MSSVSRVPLGTLFWILTAIIGVGLVEIGVRDPTSNRGLTIQPPRAIEPTIDALRSAPGRVIHDPGDAALVAGVALGRDEGMSDAERVVFRRSGLAHLTAASGQNIALLIVASSVLAWIIGGGATTTIVIALGVIPAYVLVVGGGASIIRAAIVGVLGLGCWTLGRLPSPGHATALAAGVTCVAWPGAHRMLGWQLSFACVIGLIVLAGPWAAALQRVHVPRWLAAAIGASLACSVSVLPIIVLQMGEGAGLAAVGNLIAVPLAALVLYVGLAGAVLTLVTPTVGGPLLVAAAVPARLIRRVAHQVLELPGATISFGWGPVVVLAVGALFELRSRRLHGALWLSAGAALLLWSTGGDVAAQAVLPGSVGSSSRITVLDVGQGHATLLQAAGTSVLVDFGPPGAQISRTLRLLGATPALAVMTHSSLDHRGGALDVTRAHAKVPILVPLHSPGIAQQYADRSWRGNVVAACAGDTLESGGISLHVLHPRCDGELVARTGDTDNDNAVALVADVGRLRVLITTDVEATVLNELPELVSELDTRSIDVLVVSHHGSADSGLAELLRRARPHLAVIPVGADNRYGHPHPRTTATLNAFRVPTLRTDRHGTVVVTQTGDQLRVHTIR